LKGARRDFDALIASIIAFSRAAREPGVLDRSPVTLVGVG
jgi:hypothetical protein